MTDARNLEAEARILDTLRAHDQREGAILESYRRLVGESLDEGIQYLGKLLIEDEERHHQIVNEMANRVESWMKNTAIEDSTPALSPRVDPGLLEETRRLLDCEHQDAKELRHLQKELRYTPATSLLPLLVELMLQDTAKHIEILRFIRTYTG
jgi:hypothetical protein